jgi:hypothetical protein
MDEENLILEEVKKYEELYNTGDKHYPTQRRTAEPFAGDPLRELPERQFVKLFRVSKDLFNFIVTVVEPYMRPKSRPSDLSIHTRVIKSIRFFFVCISFYVLNLGVRSTTLLCCRQLSG